MPEPFLIRAVALGHYVEVARSLAIDPYPLLRKVRLHAKDLGNPDSRISWEAAVRLLELSADAAGVEDFGLRMAQTRRLSDVGMLALLAYVEPTVRNALASMVRYLPVHTETVAVRLEESGGVAVIREEHRNVSKLRTRQMVEMSVGFLHLVMRTFLGHSWRPQRVCFTHAPPRDRSMHARFFAVPVEFNSEMDCIVCRSSDLDRPIVTADAVTAAYLHRQLGAMLTHENDSLPGQVRTLVSALLPTGRCSARAVADRLGLPPSTFYEKMAQQPQTYAEIVRSVRHELTERYLSNPNRALSEVGELLGFSCLAAFSRWVRREYGCSARDLRARSAGEASAAADRSRSAKTPARPTVSRTVGTVRRTAAGT